MTFFNLIWTFLLDQNHREALYFIGGFSIFVGGIVYKLFFKKKNLSLAQVSANDGSVAATNEHERPNAADKSRYKKIIEIYPIKLINEINGSLFSPVDLERSKFETLEKARWKHEDIELPNFIDKKLKKKESCLFKSLCELGGFLVEAYHAHRNDERLVTFKYDDYDERNPEHIKQLMDTEQEFFSRLKKLIDSFEDFRDFGNKLFSQMPPAKMEIGTLNIDNSSNKVEIKDSKLGNTGAIGANSTGSIKKGIASEDLVKILSEWKGSIESTIEAKENLSTDDKTDLKDHIAKIEKEIAKEDKAEPGRMEKLFNILNEWAPDIFDVSVEASSNPLKAIGMTWEMIKNKISITSS